MKIDWYLVRRTARKARLSGETFLLLDWIIEHICWNRYTPTDEFSVTWPMINRWTGWSRKTAYRHRNALIKWGFLRWRGEKGCPAVTLFSFFPIGAKNGPYEGAKKDHSEGATEEAPQISIPFRKEVQKKKKEDSSAPEGRNEAPVGNRPAVPADKEAAQAALAVFKALRSELEKPLPLVPRGRSGRVAAK